MTQNAWSHARQTASEAALLGEDHAGRRAFSRVEFLDYFDLNMDDVRDGYSATTLYHLYLDARVRARLLGSQVEL